MAKNKTNFTDSNVTDFINAVPDETKRNDSFALIELFKDLTGFEPKMYGPTIVGFGNYHYKYASGHEGDAPLAAFSPRKAELVLYLFPEFEVKERLLEKLGKHKASKGCVYIKKLADVDLAVLSDLVKYSIAHVQKLYPSV